MRVIKTSQVLRSVLANAYLSKIHVFVILYLVVKPFGL